MKKLFFIFFISLIVNYSRGQCPSENDFLELRVSGGVTIYGSVIIKLSHEGLLYSWLDKDFKKEAYFIRIDSLDLQNVCKIQEKLVSSIIDLNQQDLTILDSNVVSLRPSIKLEIIDLRYKKLIFLRYSSCQCEIENLITDLIDLIPVFHKDNFINNNLLRCKY